jgi:hypothetical protein
MRGLMHDFALSGDEFSAQFQSRIFATGGREATVPEQWRPFVAAVRPPYVAYREGRAVWLSSYLPVYAAIRTLFARTGHELWTNPVLAGSTAFALIATSRRLWPDRPRRGGVALIFLLASTQFVFMSMTQYSMPAHLLLSLVWLYCYLREDLWGTLLLPWIGVVALGLHRPFPHALFAAPLLLRLGRTRRPVVTAYCAAVYCAGAMVWLTYMRYARVDMMVFSLPDGKRVLQQVMNLGLVMSWQTPLAVVCLAVSLVQWRRLRAVERDLMTGIVLSFVFYFVVTDVQHHGWGYRYIHAVLGSVALLAARGFDAIIDECGERPARTLLATSIGITALLHYPFRAWSVERFVRPFERAHASLHARRTSVVLVDTSGVWYGDDLIRNDPFLTDRPVVVSSCLLGETMRDSLARANNGRAQYLKPEAAAFGLPLRVDPAARVARARATFCLHASVPHAVAP